MNMINAIGIELHRRLQPTLRERHQLLLNPALIFTLWCIHCLAPTNFVTGSSWVDEYLFFVCLLYHAFGIIG